MPCACTAVVSGAVRRRLLARRAGMREVDADASYTSFLVNVAMSSNVTPLQVSERENEGQTGSSFALAVDVMKQTDTHTKRKKENRHKRGMGGGQGPHLPARAGSWKDDQGHREREREAHRDTEGGWAGRLPTPVPLPVSLIVLPRSCSSHPSFDRPVFFLLVYLFYLPATYLPTCVKCQCAPVPCLVSCEGVLL